MLSEVNIIYFLQIIIARSASYVRRYSKTYVSVRSPSVLRPENNWFLPRVYEPTTHASVYWDFEIMVLMGPEKTCHKVKLRLKVGTLRDRFLNTFGRSFWKKLQKRVDRDYRVSGLEMTSKWVAGSVTCRQRFLKLPFSWHCQGRRFALPCPAGYSLVVKIRKSW